MCLAAAMAPSSLTYSARRGLLSRPLVELKYCPCEYGYTAGYVAVTIGNSASIERLAHLI